MCRGMYGDILYSMIASDTKTILIPLTIVAVLFLCGGCATLNFSANYYEPPGDYRVQVVWLFRKLISDLPLKNKTYQLRIVTEKESEGLKGIPAVSNQVIILPDNFIKYVYQNYYDRRNVVFTCVIVHELCHAEFDLPSSPPEEHFKTDAHTIALLGSKDADAAQYYYKSLRVMKSYWFARKGVAGHTFNVGWNALSAVSTALGGPGVFVDWFATDLSKRLDLIARHYNIKESSAFERSGSP